MGTMGQKSSRVFEARVLLLGLDSAGKSTVLYKLKYNQQFFTVPTIGFNVEMIATKRKRKKLALTVWDIGGQKKMRPHWKNFYQDTAGLIFVVDCSDRERLSEAHKEFDRILRNEHLRGLPVVIFANKQDISGAMTVGEITETFNLHKTCCDRDWYVQYCSSTAGVGLEEGFRKMARLLKL
ncbi:ADP-ribosylation factor-like protein 14 isoform X3 [Alosa pseudoharengus]|uniref:ADP-ribosylation factor-like protein 14 isoform X3 n=1 Tax=Alosa pseudoharengus TaxID=34774 RepID=UPI003F8A4F15